MLRLLVSFALCWSCEAHSKACKPQEHVLLQHGKASLNRGTNSGQRKVGLRRNNSNFELPDTIYFDAVLRDFTADHPDFESMDGHSEGLVESTLGPLGKPVYKGGPQLSNKSNFDQWFNDVPGVNRRVDFKMDLQKTDEGTYVHDNATFFPVDGKGWQDTAIALDGLAHNFYFTLELHTTFVYKSGDEFTFRGDDDVWVFMNDQLVIDLGGVHNPMEKTFQVDRLNVSQGSAVTLSFFFAERRCCGSEFRLETSIVPVKGACTIWGDPHINTFDSGLFGAENAAPVSILTSGDYWLVKNQDIQIQGRYGTTQFTVDGQSALLELAISGPFINNDTIVIQPMSGAVTWNKQPILSSIPSEFARPYARLRFTEGEKHIDSVLAGYPVKLLRGFMVRNVELIVNRWPEHIDAIIKMPQQLNGQDGHCGNFNFDPSDDTKEQILERGLGSDVPQTENIFPDKGPAAEPSVTAEKTLADCDNQVQTKAKATCEAMMSAEGDARNPQTLETCMFDYCFAGRDFAAEDAIVIHEDEEAQAEA